MIDVKSFDIAFRKAWQKTVDFLGVKYVALAILGNQHTSKKSKKIIK